MFSTSVYLYAQLRLCVVFFLLGVLTNLRAEDLVNVLWGKIEAEQLWDDPEWWTLGHYHRTMWLRVESRIDDPRFFLHPKGKTNRALELRATLEAFLSDTEGGDVERTIPCRFPARRKWLLEKLDLPDEIFPAGECEDFTNAVAQLEIESATMIYPAAYLNSPASMFGHLLLVLDRKGKDRLLSRAVNYAAVVGDSFGPLFAVKGIFGLYDGVFAILPYYDKVEEYSAVNRRDIWEYPLKLDADELDSLLRHVWELQSLKSRYFFFKENCAYNLLYPVQFARPEIKMLRRFRMSAVPVSLLQQLEDTGVTGEPMFRPSKATQMSHLADQLTPEQIQAARHLVEGGEVSGEESPELLEFAFYWVQFLYTEGEISPDEYRKTFLPLLRARSRLGKTAGARIPAPASPDQGHGPRRVSVYAGVDSVRGETVTGVKLRSAYHDWLDNPIGYPPGSSIRMFEMDVQGRPEEGTVYLNDLTLVDIRSQTPPEPWVKPLSWAVSFGGEADPVGPEHHRGFARFASGATRRAGEQGQAYLMLSQQVIWDTSLKTNISWEPGVEWGTTFFSRAYSVGLRGWHHWGVLGYDDSRHRVEAETRIFVQRNFSVGVSLTYREEEGQDQNLVFLNLNRTF